MNVKHRVVLLISDDVDFDRRLRTAAIHNGQIVIRVNRLDNTLRIIHANCCGVILLDLDSLTSKAWEWVGELMKEPLCPPLLLLTGKGGQLELRLTVFGGSILVKSAEAGKIMELVNEIIEGLRSESPGQFAAQSGIVRWEEREDGLMPRVPAHRFWGINE